MNHIGIILVNWNGKADTLNCIKTLLRLSGSDTYTIIVVDNCSADGSVENIRGVYPQIVVIENTKNEGFSGANNIGILYALRHNCTAVWLVNNDAQVSPGALTPLTKRSEDHSIGAIGSKIYFSPGLEFHRNKYAKEDRGHVLWYAGGLIDWENVYASHRGVDEIDKGQYDVPENTDFITGCSFFMTKQVIEKIGLFDERYFLYLEDLDLSIRIKRAGYGLWYEPTSVLWHNNAGSSGAGSTLHEYYQTRNRLLFGLTYASFRTKIALLRESGKFILGGNPIKRKAVLDAFMNKYGKQ